MFVAQGDPQVIILIQKHLLHPRLPDATCLIPGKGNKTRGHMWVGEARRDMGSYKAWGDTGQGDREGSQRSKVGKGQWAEGGQSCPRQKAASIQLPTSGTHSLVDIILDGQQVIAHGLKGQLVQHWGSGVEATIQDEELGASLVRTLQSHQQDHQQVSGSPMPS